MDRAKNINRNNMLELTIVSLIWAFSFGLIKTHLTGFDPFLVAWIRLFLSLLVFLPLLRLRRTPLRLNLQLFMLGMVQFGLMYAAYIYSFQFLPATLIALFTIFTPLYVTFFDHLLERRFHLRTLWRALLAVAGAGVITFTGGSAGGNLLKGFLLMQISNAAFAAGQIGYRRIMAVHDKITEREIFALCYAGSVVFVTITGLIWGCRLPSHIDTNALLVLLYLGIAASGIAFFLWNSGARKVSIGVLAVFNNLKIPLAIAVSLLVFSEKTDLFRLMIGAALMLSALIFPASRETQTDQRRNRFK